LLPCGHGGWAFLGGWARVRALAVRVILMPRVGKLRRCVPGLRVTGQSGAHVRVRRHGTCGQVRGGQQYPAPCTCKQVLLVPRCEGGLDGCVAGRSRASSGPSRPGRASGEPCVGRGDPCAAYARGEALPIGRVRRGVSWVPACGMTPRVWAVLVPECAATWWAACCGLVGGGVRRVAACGGVRRCAAAWRAAAGGGVKAWCAAEGGGVWAAAGNGGERWWVGGGVRRRATACCGVRRHNERRRAAARCAAAVGCV
jgi:hypothetical protein